LREEVGKVKRAGKARECIKGEAAEWTGIIQVCSFLV
jgi:hypothetical protein